mmetsp:Transcript_17149/g.64956  ORF Transcript_17149/g.64956 Transcript_17149/m.64956 type:complete len:485 (-) Transcript_17149:67-1521(-)
MASASSFRGHRTTAPAGAAAFPSAGTAHRASSALSAAPTAPARTAFSARTNAESRCRNTSRSTTVCCTSRGQTGLSNAKAGPPRETGGSWWKSPTSTVCTPPMGASRPRHARATASTLDRRSASTMDTSSITRQSAARHRRTVRGLRSADCTISRSGRWALPTPEKAWSVTPPTAHAAMPVDAVTTTLRASLRTAWTSLVTVRDFPVPAAPVRSMLAPALASCSTARCSAERPFAASPSRASSAADEAAARAAVSASLLDMAALLGPRTPSLAASATPHSLSRSAPSTRRSSAPAPQLMAASRECTSNFFATHSRPAQQDVRGLSRSARSAWRDVPTRARPSSSGSRVPARAHSSSKAAPVSNPRPASSHAPAKPTKAQSIPSLESGACMAPWGEGAARARRLVHESKRQACSAQGRRGSSRSRLGEDEGGGGGTAGRPFAAGPAMPSGWARPLARSRPAPAEQFELRLARGSAICPPPRMRSV